MSSSTLETSPDRSTPFIGRRVELSWLGTRLDLCAHGVPHLVVLEGEPGVGKTRLAQEFLGHARRRGFQVFTGRCYEHFALAYLPLRDSFLATVANDLQRRDDSTAASEMLNRINAGNESVGRGELDERERTRQLLTLTRLILDQARLAPLSLFIDDLHWSDPATLDLLRHVLFRFDEEDVPVLLLATTRDEPEGRAAASVAMLQSEPRCSVLRLHPLSELETTELARQLTGNSSIEASRELASASGGNPLLVQALARRPRTLGLNVPATGAGRLSHPITATATSRVDALGPDASRVLKAAAFLVPHCTRPSLAAVVGLDADRLGDALDEAIDEGLLAEDALAIVFTHPLYTRIAYDAVPPAAGRRLHHDVGMALLAQREAGVAVPLWAIVHHLLAARPDADTTLVTDLARRAGDEAMALGAWNQAARCYEATLDGHDDMASPRDIAELHRLAALCCRCDLALDRAVKHLDQAIEVLTPTGSPAMLTELHLWRIRCAVGSRELLGVVADRAALQGLIDTVEADSPGLAANGLVELSQSYWVEGRMDEAEDAARRAMALARRVDDHLAFARAATTLSVPQWLRYDLKDSLRTLEEGVADARAAADPSALVGGPLFRLPLVLAWLGRFDDAIARAHEACAAADAMRYPLEEGLPLAALAQIAVARGDYEAVDRHAERALLIQRLSGYHWAAGLFLPAWAAADIARGRYDAARDTLDTWAETADAWEQPSLTRLRRYIDALEGPLPVGGAPLPRLPRLPAVGVDSWAAAVIEVARREGDTSTNLERARDLLAEMHRRGGVMTTATCSLIPRLLGVAMDLLGDEDGSVSTLDRAIRVATSLGARPELARTQLDLAAILLRQGKRDQASSLADSAASTFERLGMSPDAERAMEILGTSAHGATGQRHGARDNRELHSVRTVLLFTDVVDSTRLCAERGNAPYHALARQLEDVVRATIAAHSGTIVTGINLGDGLIGLFPSVERAISAARSCARDAPSTGLHLHLAVNAGDVIVDGPRIFGSAVNLAARICSLTGPDEILVSEEVRARAVGLPDVAIVDRGTHTLKGFAEPQRVHAIVETLSDSHT